MNDIGATIFAAIFMIILFASPIILVIVLTAIITTLITKKTQKSKNNTNAPKPQAPPVAVNNRPIQNNTVKTITIPQIPPTPPKTQNKNQIYYNNYQNTNYKDDKERIDEYYENQYLPYRPKYLLTNNEYNFYRELKEIANEKNLIILSKIRMADLVEVEPIAKYKWDIYFNKISRKHVDFALARPENLKIELLIELDDYTHNESQYERDRFVEAVYEKTGYKLLRTRNTANLREIINEIIK